MLSGGEEEEEINSKKIKKNMRAKGPLGYNSKESL